MKICTKCQTPLEEYQRNHTPEQRFAFARSWRCPRCWPSGATTHELTPELQAQLEQMKRKGAQLDLQMEI